MTTFISFFKETVSQDGYGLKSKSLLYVCEMWVSIIFEWLILYVTGFCVLTLKSSL
jgi:hypothetical protein